MNMTDITHLATGYANAHDELCTAVAMLQDELREVKTRHLDAIKAGVRITATAHTALHAAIEAAPELFEKPKTQTVDGIRFGFAKQRGRIAIEDERATIERIRKLLPEDQAELLVRVRESVDRTAVTDLTAGDLKRLGIRIEDDHDAVVIRAVDSDVDKLVSKLLDEAEKEDAA